MIDDLHQLLSVANELSGEWTWAPSTIENRTYLINNFDRWRSANAPQDSLDERLVLGYLLDHPDWSWSRARFAIDAIAWHCKRTQQRSPVTRTVRRYVEEIGMRKGKDALPLVEPLRAERAADIAATLDSEAHGPTSSRWSEMVPTLRTLLVAARRFSRPDEQLIDVFAQLTHRRTATLAIHPNGAGTLTIALTGRVVTMQLDAAQSSGYTEQLRRRHDQPRNAGRRLKAAMLRTGIQPDIHVSNLSDEQWNWLWANLDPWTPRRVRNRAYVLVGFIDARRHAELAAALIEDVTPLRDGYQILYRHTKNGHDHRATISHLAADPADCPAACPACALADVLDFERVCHGRSSDLLLPTTWNGDFHKMTCRNGTLVVRALNKQAFGEERGSTRSLRAGGATSAADAGWTLQQIAELTDHRDLTQAAKYVRRHGSAFGTLQLGPDD